MKRQSYYVERKSVLIWIAVLLLVGSAGFRIAYFCEKGADTATVWFQLVLPVLAIAICALRIVLDGREHFYKTALPVFLFALYLALAALQCDLGFWLTAVSWVLCLAFFVLYRQITAGYLNARWLLPLLFLALSAWFTYRLLPLEDASPLGVLMRATNVMAGLALVLVTLSMREHTDGKYHPTWGDRPDGRRVRTMTPMSRVQSYIMPTRTGSSNYLRDSVEITEIERYIREKRKQGMTTFGITEVFLAAYVHCMARFPACNRFISGQRFYTRDEDIQFCMVIKKEMTKEAPDTVIKLHLHPSDTAEQIYEKFHAAVEEVHNTPLDSAFDNLAAVLASMPGVTLKFAVWVLKTMDYFGLIPKFLLELSPFHGSVFFTSLGSLGILPVFHHLYDFGNLPVFCAFGCKRRQNDPQRDGVVRPGRYIDYTFTIDERTVDGFYYAETMKYFKRLLRDPYRLDVPEEVRRDLD